MSDPTSNRAALPEVARVKVITAEPTMPRADGTMGGPYRYAVEYVRDQTDEWENDRGDAAAPRPRAGRVSAAQKGNRGSSGAEQPALAGEKWWD